ncbi:hypothetical protein T265_03669 [Opisthorchis viverrini]|uniref:Uncharacterized protein n=1 Tax=Opisthorchis viverrini TaxID=6198 RepID=A0A074ZQS1_OPIVI|nr:hypothetical protein T265_03669 [Opisthorchis viverrini]KER29758.1 hypothetical protein T265_03669 [Opisthorchis viverrini]
MYKNHHERHGLINCEMQGNGSQKTLNVGEKRLVHQTQQGLIIKLVFLWEIRMVNGQITSPPERSTTNSEDSVN